MAIQRALSIHQILLAVHHVTVYEYKTISFDVPLLFNQHALCIPFKTNRSYTEKKNTGLPFELCRTCQIDTELINKTV